MAEYEFKIEYNGITLDFSNGFIIKRVEGVDNPEIRISREDLTGRDGGNVWKRLYAMRGISIEGSVFGRTVDEYFTNRKNLSLAFDKNSNAYMTITLWDGSSKRIKAKAIQLPEMPFLESEVDHGEFRVEVIAENPYWEDLAKTDYSATLSQPVGLAIPFTLPATMGNSDPSDTITINNVGSIPVIPYIKITGSVNNPKVTNITTGKEFTITTTIPTDEYVELYADTSGKTVLLNSTTKYWQYLSGNLFEIIEGTNQVKFSANSFSAEALLEIQYTSNYLTVK